MTHFSGYKSTPITSRPVPIEDSPNDFAGWNTLDELQYFVTAKGCQKARFDEAIAAVGSDPYRIATYLQPYIFTAHDTSGE